MKRNDGAKAGYANPVEFGDIEMPFSSLTFDSEVQEILRNFLKAGCQRFLDVGAGQGKYGYMIRQLSASPFVEAVEIESSYITKFNLQNIYDNIIIGDIVNFIDDRPDYATDVVIMGDVLEHMKKSDGIDLLNYFLYRSKHIIIIVPERYVQYSYEGVNAEAHRSAWLSDDFKGFDHEEYHKQGIGGDANWKFGLYIVNGYI